jgi:uncharacterized damage-inducible protein DinB
MSTMADRYRRWFAYEVDSHQKTLASIEAARSVAASPRFQKAVELMAHIMAARQLWLFRFGVAGEAPRDFFPKGLPVAELAARVRSTQEMWAAYLERLDDAELARVFTYQSLDGGFFQNTIEDILTQLFGHSWYHRGQIALSLRDAGAEPVPTDFVYWTRESIPPPE